MMCVTQAKVTECYDRGSHAQNSCINLSLQSSCIILIQLLFFKKLNTSVYSNLL